MSASKRPVAGCILSNAECRVFVDPERSGADYFLPRPATPFLKVTIGLDRDREADMAGALMHELTESYLHMSMKAFTPAWSAEPNGVLNRIFVLTHADLDEMCHDVGHTFVNVWPSVKAKWDQKQQRRAEAWRKKQKRKRGTC